MAHMHIYVMEAFNPNLTADPFRWIPKGLMQDLMDVTNETNPPGVINDAVSGVTISQLFAALLLPWFVSAAVVRVHTNHSPEY